MHEKWSTNLEQLCLGWVCNWLLDRSGTLARSLPVQHKNKSLTSPLWLFKVVSSGLQQLPLGFSPWVSVCKFHGNRVFEIECLVWCIIIIMASRIFCRAFRSRCSALSWKYRLLRKICRKKSAKKNRPPCRRDSQWDPHGLPPLRPRRQVVNGMVNGCFWWNSGQKGMFFLFHRDLLDPVCILLGFLDAVVAWVQNHQNTKAKQNLDVSMNPHHKLGQPPHRGFQSPSICQALSGSHRQIRYHHNWKKRKTKNQRNRYTIDRPNTMSTALYLKNYVLI